MLVLSRKLQQSIRIGDSVTVTILRVKGKMVRVGIEAPADMKIVRAELPDYAAFTDDEAADDSRTASAAASAPPQKAAGNPAGSLAPAPFEFDEEEMPLGFTDHPLIGWESSESGAGRPR